LADGRVIQVVTVDHMMISPTNEDFAVFGADGELHIIGSSTVTSISRSKPVGKKNDGG